jgi:hypothetical protein
MEEMVTQARNEASPPPERIKPVVHVTRTMKKSPRSPPADAPTSGGGAAAVMPPFFPQDVAEQEEDSRRVEAWVEAAAAATPPLRTLKKEVAVARGGARHGSAAADCDNLVHHDRSGLHLHGMAATEAAAEATKEMTKAGAKEGATGARRQSKMLDDYTLSDDLYTISPASTRAGAQRNGVPRRLTCHLLG